MHVSHTDTCPNWHGGKDQRPYEIGKTSNEDKWMIPYLVWPPAKSTYICYIDTI